MMTDRELLVLAAKAAGVPGHFFENHPEDGAPTYSCGIGFPARLTIWNSLTNKGDAMGLQVSLMLDVRHTSDEVAVRALFDEWMTEPVCGDRLQATCRATTRAAAAIGKVMP